VALFLLSPIAMWKGATEPRLDRLPWVAALFGLLTLLVWELPAWTPTGEAIRIEGAVQAVLPGAWAPAALVPLISAAALLAAFHAAAGLWLERRAPSPLVSRSLRYCLPGSERRPPSRSGGYETVFPLVPRPQGSLGPCPHLRSPNS
jgi:hypothetical protein